MNKIKDYKIIIGTSATMNEKRAASFLQTNIRLVTGAKVSVLADSETPCELEICVGRTNREILCGLSFERSESRLWEYQIISVGKRVFLIGLGAGDSEALPYTTAYRLINDGAYGTMFAAYRFVEEVLGYDFVYSTYEEFPEDPDLRMPENYSADYTKEALRAELPEKGEGAMMWSTQSCEVLNWNMSCTIFRSRDGKLAILDGGREEDAEHIIKMLEAISAPEKPTVSAWLFSHMHNDHYGVYKKLCETPSLAARLNIENFYCHLLPDEFYTQVSKEPNPKFGAMRRMMLDSENTLGVKIHRVTAGDEIKVDELSFRVIHTPDMAFAKDMNMNDSSVIYQLCYDGGQKIMFLSDAEFVCSNDLLDNHRDELKSDVVQVGHHGCGNVSKKCYEAIGADAYLWQIGNRFWYGDNGEGLNTHNVGVIRTRCFMKELGAKAENIYRDTNGILALGLPIKIK